MATTLCSLFFAVVSTHHVARAQPLDTTVLIETPGRPESAVASSGAFYVSQFQQDGTVLKYSLDGELLADFLSPVFANPRGLALNAASTTLWAAPDGAVVEMALGGNAATMTNYYDVSDLMPAPNGLCLSPDESTLYVTDPEVKMLLKIDLGTGVATKLFDSTSPNGDAQSPNGCFATDDTVWLIARDEPGGITAFDIAGGTVGLTEPWSQPIANATGSMVGDGIVLYENKVYASVWEFVIGPGGITTNGIVFVCEPPASCIELAPLVAADLQVDSKTPDAPRLLLPDLLMGKVDTIPLPAPETPAPVVSPTTVPTAGKGKGKGKGKGSKKGTMGKKGHRRGLH